MKLYYMANFGILETLTPKQRLGVNIGFYGGAGLGIAGSGLIANHIHRKKLEKLRESPFENEEERYYSNSQRSERYMQNSYRTLRMGTGGAILGTIGAASLLKVKPTQNVR